MPAHLYSSEAAYNASRTRRKPPSAKWLAGATKHRGCYYQQRATVRGQKWDVWMPMYETQDGGWTWTYTEKLVLLLIDRRLDAAEKLRAMGIGR